MHVHALAYMQGGIVLITYFDLEEMSNINYDNLICGEVGESSDFCGQSF